METDSTHPDPATRLTPAFLEEVLGEEALTWVRERNQRTKDALAASPQQPSLAELEERILSVLDNPGRIPMVQVRGSFAYNFWTDEQNTRGLWRRQPLNEYLAGSENWDVLIDVDELSRQEEKSWVWHGAAICPTDHSRVLVTLSPGGSDADETREFDVEGRRWVEGGFLRTEGKGSLTWLTRDLCWVTQPTSPETTSASGYPLQAGLLRRGQDVEDAKIILTAPAESMGVWVGVIRDQVGTRSIIRVMEDFYTSTTHLVSSAPDAIGTDSPQLLPLPSSAEVSVWNEWVLVWLREDWTYNGETYAAGSLVGADLTDLWSRPDAAPLTVLFVPDREEVLEGLTATRSQLVLTTIRNVVSQVTVLTPAGDDGQWDSSTISMPAASSFSTVVVRPVERTESDDLWLTTTGYTEPSTLWLAKHVSGSDQWLINKVRQAPELFESNNVKVTQNFAVSEDGTRVPYFLVAREDVVYPAPTLLYGYGGFDVSLLPAYAPAVGKAWIEEGGVYVVANIRGGGEYGPTWHRSALKQNRHRAFEDFVSVARDLVARGITTPSQLGAQGGSNGGLLMGNMYTRYPGDFGAILCQVPLLDMGRYHTLLAGHSWIAEYGDPENPDEWAFIRTFSPVHQFNAEHDYPPLMLTTSTKDDRVHPGHARSLGYLAENAGKQVLYYENIEGGHAGAADNRQRAHNQALGWAFLWRSLGSSNISGARNSEKS